MRDVIIVNFSSSNFLCHAFDFVHTLKYFTKKAFVVVNLLHFFAILPYLEIHDVIRDVIIANF